MALTGPRTFQTTFRVTLPDAPIPPYHARRSHRKSRTGCTTCKKRRVKCDERKPTCARCENYGATCAYPPPSPASSRTRSMAVEPSRTLFSLSVADMVGRIKDTMAGELTLAPRAIGDRDAVITMAVRSFQFFLTSSINSVGTAMIRQVMRREMIHVAFDNPYLMYTILGCGIIHMNRICPGDQSRELAEAYFWQQATGLYSKALHCNVNETNIDGLLSACMLMGTTPLIPLQFEIQDSWVFTGRAGDLNWLAIQGGLATILKVAGQYLPGSIWAAPFLTNHDYESKLFQYDIEQGRQGLHPALADLCGIDENTTAETNPYYFPIKILSPMLELEANPENGARCTTWMGRLDPEFVTLCRRRDQRALVILVYWMGLMCSQAKWQVWVEGRVRKECFAVCIYLESLGDPVIQTFLEYPASACGYTLIAKE